MSVKYVKGSLFEAPEGSLLVHACNTQGVWGSGIAKAFKEKFPKSFDLYNKYCLWDGSRKDLRGTFWTSPWPVEEKHRVGCVFTSAGFGSRVDDVETILIHSVLAVEQVLIHATRESNMNNDITTVYSNKFNSGLFGVPWERTEKVINTLLLKYPKVQWVVHTGE